jgi:hypothetical protein
VSRRSPIARATTTALPLPGIDAGEPIASTTATPANDARAIRRARAVMDDFGPALRAAMEPALKPLARISGDDAGVDTSEDAAELVALVLRTDLVCSVAQGAAGWEMRVARTLWEGEATVRIVYATPDGAGLSWGTTSFVCKSAEDIARRVSGWMARFDGPVRVAAAHAIDVECDGATVASLRWREDAWQMVDEAGERARLETARLAAREAAQDTERADALDTAHALELQRMNAEGVPVHALDDAPQTPRAEAPVVPTPSRDAPIGPSKERPAVERRSPRKASGAGAEASSAREATKSSGGPPKASDGARERRAAKSPTRAARGAA